jgi:hypothetical protein
MIVRQVDVQAAARHGDERDAIGRRKRTDEADCSIDRVPADARPKRLVFDDQDDRAPALAERVAAERRRHRIGCPRRGADEPQRPDLTHASVDAKREVGFGKIGHGLPVLSERAEVERHELHRRGRLRLVRARQRSRQGQHHACGESHHACGSGLT